MDKKVHYKMRKRKKQWIVIGISIMSGVVLVFQTNTSSASAAETSADSGTLVMSTEPASATATSTEKSSLTTEVSADTSVSAESPQSTEVTQPNQTEVAQPELAATAASSAPSESPATPATQTPTVRDTTDVKENQNIAVSNGQSGSDVKNTAPTSSDTSTNSTNATTDSSVIADSSGTTSTQAQNETVATTTTTETKEATTETSTTLPTQPATGASESKAPTETAESTSDQEQAATATTAADTQKTSTDRNESTSPAVEKNTSASSTTVTETKAADANAATQPTKTDLASTSPVPAGDSTSTDPAPKWDKPYFDPADLAKIKDPNLQLLLRDYLVHNQFHVTYGYDNDNMQATFQNGYTLADLQWIWIDPQWHLPEGFTIHSLEGLENAQNLQYISLPGQEISSIEPLAELSHLKVIDLSNNQATGTLPNAWGNPDLAFVNIRGNKITGEFGPNWQNLPNLLELNALGNGLLNGQPIGNYLTGELPSNWPKIYTLNLANNGLTGDIPASWVNQKFVHFGDQKGLFILDLSRNKLHSGYQNETTGTILPSDDPAVSDGIASSSIIVNQDLGTVTWQISADHKTATLDLNSFYHGILQSDGTFSLPTTGVNEAPDIYKKNFYYTVKEWNDPTLLNQRLKFENGKFILDLVGLTPNQKLSMDVTIGDVRVPYDYVELKYGDITKAYNLGIVYHGIATSELTVPEPFTSVNVHFVSAKDTGKELKPAVTLGNQLVASTIDLSKAGLDPTINGYTLASKLNPNYVVRADGNNIYLLYLANDYAITFDSAGGSKVPDQNYTIETGADHFTHPTKAGYQFVNWLDENGNPITAIKVGATGDRHLTASWQANDYTITFDSAGGSKVPDETYTIKTGADQFATPTKAGYQFVNWLDESGNPITAIKVGTTGDRHLTATWQAIDYVVHFDSAGGSEVPDQNYTIETGIPDFTKPTKSGFDFVGWKDSTGKLFTKIAIGTTGDLTLTADWAKHEGGKDEPVPPENPDQPTPENPVPDQPVPENPVPGNPEPDQPVPTQPIPDQAGTTITEPTTATSDGAATGQTESAAQSSTDFGDQNLSLTNSQVAQPLVMKKAAEVAVPTAPKETQTASPSQLSTAPTHANYPQTGEQTNHLSLLGWLIAGIVGTLGTSLFKKRN
ncbi:InlB B-repeat-containing protein [Enterococcus sp. CSURQ0835]|uniref:InlB B-repeat-containing protein n=1 Tax=Enterococcus sp. CSURQ0835 TaxID=2681394 RepID=UPI001357539F|nr:InlB B-repeat-containing protein [Enterococcus sp. CSURQ0835]